MLNLTNPELDWVSLARGMGVPAQRVDTVSDLARAIRAALDSSGPRLIEAMIP